MKVSVLIPCHNEATTIGKVIDDFRRELPDAEIYVYDNKSTDDTAKIARERGATVRFSPRLGKGRVVQQMFNEISSDVYIMVDGDDTYHADDVHALLEPVVEDRCDMCIGNRLAAFEAGSFSFLHLFGNKLISFLMKNLYHQKIDDMLSGLRVMNNSIVQELCLVFGGFEIETEINIKTVWSGYRIESIPIKYSERPQGSLTKIKTFSDGYRILLTLFMLLRESQPVTITGICFLLLCLLGLNSSVYGYYSNNLYAFAGGLCLGLVGVVILCSGMVVHAINISSHETADRIRKLKKHVDQTSSGPPQ